MIITKHARKRWPERGNKDVAPEDIDREIEGAFNQGVIVHEEGESGEGLIQYRVNENILFIYNMTNDKMITLVDIDFGFSPEVNLELCRLQTRRVLDLKEKLAGEQQTLEILQEALDYKLLAAADEITRLETALDAARAVESRLKLEKTEKAKVFTAMQTEFDNEFMRLKFSIRYRVDVTKTKQAG